MSLVESKRRDLGQFLRLQREGVTPGDAGIRTTARRRVKGLRRDEVAELADISVTWYTWLEQGRDVNVSAQALERIAAALRCDDQQKQYLFQLAGMNPPLRDEATARPPSNLQAVLDALNPSPAYVVCARFDLIAWNAAAIAVFGDFGRYPADARNLLWILYSDVSMRELIVDWERFVRCLTAWFRIGYAKVPGEPKWRELVDALSRVSPEFRTWWAMHDVARPPHWAKELRHPAGRLVLEHMTMHLDATPGYNMTVFTPAHGTGTAEVLSKLHVVH